MKKCLFFMLAILLSPAGHSQLWKLRRMEIYFGAGSTHFSGDIGGNRSNGSYRYTAGDLLFYQTGFNFTAGARYRLLRNFSARAGFTAGTFNSEDIRGSMRSFKSHTAFFESAVAGEIYFVKNRIEDDYRIMKEKPEYIYSFWDRIDAYVFAGFGGIMYKVTPNAILAPDVTKDRGFAPVLPAGIGADVFLSTHWNAGLEISGRYAFSDNLDGYGATNSTNDAYYFVNISLTRKFRLQKFPDF
jgi:hypothetical protein